MHLKSDALTIAYRRWLNELGVENGVIALSDEKRSKRKSSLVQ